jgi:hypothetical protein
MNNTIKLEPTENPIKEELKTFAAKEEETKHAQNSPEHHKFVLYRLVSNMCVTANSKPNLNLYVTLGQHHMEGISFNQFINLFDSLESACHRSLIHFTKYELATEFFFGSQIVGIYTMDGSKPTFVRRSIRSRLLFQNEFRAALQFTLSEVIPCEPVENGIPQRVQIYERWSFTHKSKVRYELIKTTSGKTKEDACAQNPMFLVRMFINPLNRTHFYTEMLLRKSFDIFGFGSNPELKHVALRHMGRKKETKK